jgi:hypothetical protein
MDIMAERLVLQMTQNNIETSKSCFLVITPGV